MYTVRELELIRGDVSRSTSQEERVTALLAHHPEVTGGCLLIVPQYLCRPFP
jgi:hypothetical protein